MRLLSTFVALALSASAATAGDLTPLSPGRPAGVKAAQASDNTLVFAVIGVGAVALIAYAVAQGGNTTLSPMVPPGTSVVSGTAS
jgi:hypothetical protein